jgi:hypothetical protein
MAPSWLWTPDVSATAVEKNLLKSERGIINVRTVRETIAMLPEAAAGQEGTSNHA